MTAIKTLQKRLDRLEDHPTAELDIVELVLRALTRDEIEKSFKAFKNEIDILPLNTHSEKTTRGFIFIAFLSLTIRTRLINRMRKANILDKYSVERILLQLEKLRKTF